MFKKTKEKINNNEYVILFKKLWANKRYRSLLILFLYFIFFGLIIGSVRSNYKNIEDYPIEDKKEELSIVEKMTSWDNYNSDYQYKIVVNDKEKAICNIEDGIVNLTVNDKNYMIINNNIYLNKNDDLKKMNKIDDLKISIPIIKLNIKNIMDYLKTLEIDSYEENNINYYVPTSYFVDGEEESVSVEVVGDTNLEKIIINYPEEKIMLEMGD